MAARGTKDGKRGRRKDRDAQTVVIANWSERWQDAAKEARRMIGSTTVDVSKRERTMATRKMVSRVGAKTASVVMMDCSSCTRAPERYCSISPHIFLFYLII